MGKRAEIGEIRERAAGSFKKLDEGKWRRWRDADQEPAPPKGLKKDERRPLEPYRVGGKEAEGPPTPEARDLERRAAEEHLARDSTERAREKAEAEHAKHKPYMPDPAADPNGDGVADAARVGVPGMETPPPPSIPRLPNLDPKERAEESAFADYAEGSTQKLVDAFYADAAKDKFTFETDAAKNLNPAWERPDLPPDQKGKPVHPERAEYRATMNTALHQTANAIAKQAFLKRLDEIAELPPDQRKVLVTSGGVAGGKGTALDARPELKAKVAATWDAAGEQNSTENPWVLAECQKRGIEPLFLYVHADPAETWPRVISRAKGIGRMVDARVFADSYAHGAKNFADFAKASAGKAQFQYARAPKGPDPDGKYRATFVDQMPPEATAVDAESTYRQAMKYVDEKRDELPPYIVRGATAGTRIWGGHSW